MSRRELSIDRDRLFRRLAEINAINRQTDGSCSRLALTDADRQGRDLLVRWMRELNLEIRIDEIGNVMGIAAGKMAAAPVMTGSHIDTVSTGGPYDGTLGVLAGLEVIATLQSAGEMTERPLAVAAFTNEEGVRFAPDMMGSLVYVGGLSLQSALESKDVGGRSCGEELRRIGYSGPARCGEVTPYAYVELHIEQGPVLFREGGILGAVRDLQGISWLEVTLRGVSNHAGTTPMSLRHDAAYCAARIAVFARDLARRMGGSQVATVGSLQVIPNLTNVIAREARMTVDLRNVDDAMLTAAETELTAFVHQLTEQEGVRVDMRRLVRTQPVQFDERILRTIEAVASDLGYDGIRRMTSGAGHDAQMMARICPAAMIFVPSVQGISHNPAEHTEPAHIECGANVLLHTMRRLANEISDTDGQPSPGGSR